MHNIFVLCLTGVVSTTLTALAMAALTRLMHTVCAHTKQNRRGADLLRQPQAVAAIITAILAEELGQDASAIHIASIEKLSGKGNLYETL